jgi:predicted nucleotidyltransferase
LGSVARQAADDASDLDLLVDLEPGRTLLDLVALELDLAALLGCRVDVGTRLRPSFTLVSSLRLPSSDVRGRA